MAITGFNESDRVQDWSSLPPSSPPQHSPLSTPTSTGSRQLGEHDEDINLDDAPYRISPTPGPSRVHHASQPIPEICETMPPATVNAPRTPSPSRSAGTHTSTFVPSRFEGRKIIEADSDDSGVFEPSSPVRTKEDRKRKGIKRRQATMEKNKLEREARQAREQVEAEIAAKAVARAEMDRKREVAKSVMDTMNAGRLTLAELLLLLFDPGEEGVTERGWRWFNFFQDTKAVHRILEFMVGKKNSRSARHTAERGMLKVVSRTVGLEADKITRAGVLRPPSYETVDEDFVLGLKFTELEDTIQLHCPNLSELLQGVVRTARQAKECTAKKLSQKRFLAAWFAAGLLGERSQRNSYLQHVMGLYLVSSGASRQVHAVLNHLGVSVSYTTLIGGGTSKKKVTITADESSAPANPTALAAEPAPTANAGDTPSSHSIDTHATEPEPEPEPRASGIDVVNRGDAGHGQVTADVVLNGMNTGTSTDTTTQGSVPDEALKAPADADAANTSVSSNKAPEKRTRRTGTLDKFSTSMRRLARIVALLPSFVVYDNINWNLKIAEQILLRTDSMQNGTCATLIKLFEADWDNLSTEEMENVFDNAPPLDLTDIELTPDETRLQRATFIHVVLRAAVRYGGEAFEKFRQQVADSLPETELKIPVHKTEFYPLPAFEIDESSKAGNATFVDAATEELEIIDFLKARGLAGDQLSIARLREVAEARAGNEGGKDALRWVYFIPGIFHYKLAGTTGILLDHLGPSGHDLTNPASLTAHNAVLTRKPIVSTSLPTFRTCRDLILVSLTARLLHCLLLVSGKDTLDDYATSATWDSFQADAAAVVDRFANPRVVHNLRRERTRNGEKHGDMVFENAVLFNRDALLLREFIDAIKAGDSGRIIIVLKVWAFTFRAQGRVKYALEVLYLIHNLTHVWPQGLRDIVLKNWLVNTTGNPFGFLEVDLLQEHMNFWIKTYFQAHGSNASWEWLKTIAPCVRVLRKLSTDINSALGSKQGTRHAEPDLSDDIQELMDSLQHHSVYTVKPGRHFDADDDSLVADAVARGHAMLTTGPTSPLNAFNERFRSLQHQYRVPPVVGRARAGSDSGGSSGSSDDSDAEQPIPHPTSQTEQPLPPNQMPLANPQPAPGASAGDDDDDDSSVGEEDEGADLFAPLGEDDVDLEQDADSFMLGEDAGDVGEHDWDAEYNPDSDIERDVPSEDEADIEGDDVFS
ncbi:unnamed protein product [Peniophora sp. CBMAI 1063]|nr:unnamed protein product [Peniophora sp. CBMAI 1063]